jgi:hypothetical protein
MKTILQLSQSGRIEINCIRANGGIANKGSYPGCTLVGVGNYAAAKYHSSKT